MGLERREQVGRGSVADVFRAVAASVGGSDGAGGGTPADAERAEGAEAEPGVDKVVVRGEVGAGWKPTAGAQYAVKVLRASGGASALEDMRNEMEAASRVRHPNVVRLLHARECSVQLGGKRRATKTCVLVLELLTPTTPLHESIRDGDILDRRAIALDLVRALAAAHKAGFAHRDIKSPNVLLTIGRRERRVVAKLCDFSSAAALEDSVPTCKQQEQSSGAMGLLESLANALLGSEGWRPIGSLLWMAPEMLSPPEEGSERALDPAAKGKADVFSFAVVLWELLTGRLPWLEEGISDAATGRDELRRRLVEEGERLPIPESVGQELRTLLKDCWHENPAKRPSMARLATRLADAPRSAWPTLSEEEEAAVAATARLAAAQSILASGTFTLDIKGETVVLDQVDITLGRSKECTVSIPDKRASRAHAELRFVLDGEDWEGDSKGGDSGGAPTTGSRGWSKVTKNADGSIEFIGGEEVETEDDAEYLDNGEQPAGQGGFFVMRDCGSSNGTEVNGLKLAAGTWVRLLDGDEVRVGRCVMRFTVQQLARALA